MSRVSFRLANGLWHSNRGKDWSTMRPSEKWVSGGRLAWIMGRRFSDTNPCSRQTTRSPDRGFNGASGCLIASCLTTLVHDSIELVDLVRKCMLGAQTGGAAGPRCLCGNYK